MHIINQDDVYSRPEGNTSSDGIFEETIEDVLLMFLVLDRISLCRQSRIIVAFQIH
jgi:hypothetical protein